MLINLFKINRLISYPLRDKEVGISSTSIISIRRENQVFTIIGEYWECIKSPIMSDSCKTSPVQIDHKKVKWVTSFCLMI